MAVEKNGETWGDDAQPYDPAEQLMSKINDYLNAKDPERYFKKEYGPEQLSLLSRVCAIAFAGSVAIAGVDILYNAYISFSHAIATMPNQVH